MKYKNGLARQIREKQEFQQQQENIKKKHHIEDEDVVVVEKSNMVKFFVRLLLGITGLQHPRDHNTGRDRTYYYRISGATRRAYGCINRYFL